MSASRNRRFWMTSLLLLGIPGVLALVPAKQAVQAELAGPGASDRQVTLIVSHILEREHLLKKPIDDEVSERALSAFLEGRDYVCGGRFTAADLYVGAQVDWGTYKKNKTMAKTKK